MFDWFQAVPGRLYVVGTLLPLAAFVLLLVAGGIRSLCRPFRQEGGFASSVYWLCGGDTPLKTGAYVATASMFLAAVIGVAGLVMFLKDETTGAERAARWQERIHWIRLGPLNTASPPVWEKQRADRRQQRKADPTRSIPEPPTPPTALALELGYKIDHLTAVVFAMVTVVGTLIFIFSLGYMKDETQEKVEDHEVDKQTPVRGGLGATGHDPDGHHPAADASASHG